MIRFKEYEEIKLNEAKGQLDISIKPVGKYLTSKKKIQEFLNTPCTVEHKTDGVKITALKVKSQGRISDWIIAYKGNIIFQDEFDFAADSSIKRESIGASQFKFVLEHFNNISKDAKSIPNGTELFIEFLMRKPTLSSDYIRKHGMVLIGHTKSSYKEKNGKLVTKPGLFDISERDMYAGLCSLDVPAVLFEGILGNKQGFEKGISNKHLKDIFKKEQFSINWDHDELLLDDLRSIFLEIESKYGGREEGVIIQMGTTVLKWQQEYQIDQEARRELKLKYQNENPEDETQYWNNIRRVSLEISRTIVVTNESKLQDLVKEISSNIKNLRLDFTHEKKSKININDDIQLTTKTIIMRKLKGNNNALILGKFRVLTSAHYQMIQDSLDKFDGVVVALITSKDTKDSKDLRREMLETAFGKKIEIIESTSGNLFTLINKTFENINYVVAGTDRVNSYKNQLKKNPDIQVYEIPRVDEDISASKVISEIENKEYFKVNTNPKIHKLYSKILDFYENI